MNFTFKTEWLDLLVMSAADDDANIMLVLKAIKRLALEGVRTDTESNEDNLYLLPEGVKYALNLIMDGIQADRVEAEIKRKNLSEKRAESGRKGGRKQKQTEAIAKQMQANAKQNEANGSKEREKKEEKKEVPPTPPLESKEVSKEKESTARSVDNTNVLSSSLACAEPEKPASTPEPEPLITLPLNDGSEFPVFPDMVSEFSALYPAVNVMQELRNMRGWILGKPERRKTKRGIRAFITTWLSKEQDRGPRQVARSGTTQRRLTPEEVAALPALDPFAELRKR